HDVLVCVQTGKSVHDTNRLKFHGNQFFVKSAEEMLRVFDGAPQVLARTMAIAERCHAQLQKVSNPFPEFEIPNGYSLDSYFERICREGFNRRLETLRATVQQGRLRHPISEYEQRLAREIAVIQQM